MADSPKPRTPPEGYRFSLGTLCVAAGFMLAAALASAATLHTIALRLAACERSHDVERDGTGGGQ